MGWEKLAPTMASILPSEPPGTSVLMARLQSITYAAKDAVLFEFAAVKGVLPPARAGAHLDIYLPTGPRQYSLVTPLCSAERYVVAVKREPDGRGGSLWLHDEARVGAQFQIGHPRHNFELDETADATLLLAGGIGITPIYAMFARLQALRRPVHLHYWSRSAEHALFYDSLRVSPDVNLHYANDAERAVVADIVQAAAAGTAIYCCGPGRMIEECQASTPSACTLYIEHFSNRAVAASAGAAQGFTVHLERDGRDIQVAPGETILAALLAAGVDVPYSCEEGMCGACEAKVLDGMPLHKDTVRSPEAHMQLRTMMICCSSSQGPRLILDI
jgi:ferredoxin-NADP reductase